ncbi:peptidase, M61 glycyl aminopeptidase family protein [Leptospira ryugenii]|uniref:Peptidase, M61 glycyl aminopeptidase family protein n=1 Tax=Leptospira ryugenii TaxID=1917863 RepID=A0A2P2E545_9LEPT|nr:M61 family metallopeptidase [Leptospira ryugenii]GBF51984.1 peptidase, M61 glycyl aminopeptidase family protein [Leptospira ryugenii]
MSLPHSELNASILYRVQILDPIQHYYQVELVQNSEKETLTFVMPSWTPGSYMIRDYSTHLHKFSAFDGRNDTELFWEQIGLHTWKVPNPSGVIKLKYIIYAFEDFTVRTNHLESQFGFINPCAFFLYEESSLQLPSIVQFETNSFFSKIYSSLPRTNEEMVFFSRHYDELFDSPFHLTNENSLNFQFEGNHYELLVEGDVSFEFKEKLLEDIKRIVYTENDWMNDHPNPYYLFIVNLSQSTYGGLEHSACSVNYFPPEHIDEEGEYKKLLELLAHEYFHLWNVKRIRPIALGPFDYQIPNLTRELWIAEGITSFCDIYFLLLTGHITKNEYFERLAEDIASLEETSAEDWMSLEESSFTAWTKYYKRNSNSQNITVSYYLKGALLAFCMNAFLLYNTEGQKSIQDVMRSIYQEYAIKKNRGITKQDFFDAVQTETGLNLKTEFDQHLIARRKLPVSDYLYLMGLEFLKEDPISDLGFKTKEKAGNVFVSKIYQRSLQQTTSFQIEDEIIAVNGRRVNRNLFEKMEKKFRPNEKVLFTIARNGKLLEILTETQKTFKTKKIVPLQTMSDLQRKIQNQFLLEIG